MISKAYTTLAATSLILLTACGGGGEESPTKSPTIPIPTTSIFTSGTFKGSFDDYTTDTRFETFGVVDRNGELRLGLTDSGETLVANLSVDSNSNIMSTGVGYDYSGEFAFIFKVSGKMTSSGYDLDLIDNNDVIVGKVDVDLDTVTNNANSDIKGFYFLEEGDFQQYTKVSEDGNFTGYDTEGASEVCSYSGTFDPQNNSVYSVSISISSCVYAGSYNGLATVLPASISESGYDEAWVHVSDSNRALTRVGLKINNEPKQPVLAPGLYTTETGKFMVLMLDEEQNATVIQSSDTGYITYSGRLDYRGWSILLSGRSYARETILSPSTSSAFVIPKSSFSPTSENTDDINFYGYGSDPDNTGTFRYAPLTSNTTTQLVDVQGRYEYENGSFYDITSDGVFSGINGIGCTSIGQITKRDTLPNWYDATFVVSNCEYSGEYSLVGYIATPETSDFDTYSITLIGNSTSYSISMRLSSEFLTNAQIR